MGGLAVDPSVRVMSSLSPTHTPIHTPIPGLWAAGEVIVCAHHGVVVSLLLEAVGGVWKGCARGDCVGRVKASGEGRPENEQMY